MCRFALSTTNCSSCKQRDQTYSLVCSCCLQRRWFSLHLGPYLDMHCGGLSLRLPRQMQSYPQQRELYVSVLLDFPQSLSVSRCSQLLNTRMPTSKLYKFSKNVEAYLRKRIGKCLNGAVQAIQLSFSMAFSASKIIFVFLIF